MMLIKMVQVQDILIITKYVYLLVSKLTQVNILVQRFTVEVPELVTQPEHLHLASNIVLG